jgi:uncharacterized protein (TIGR03032 family)
MVSDAVFALTTSRGFADWLAATGGSLAFTTYQAGKIFLLGTKPDGSLSVFERSFPRVMGLAVARGGQSLCLATHYQIFRFDNVLGPGERQGDIDAVLSPHATWITGDLDIHDMIVGHDDRPIFVNTLFNCISTVDDGHSFRPLWRPPFISRLVAEDRCHLNGLAQENGTPRFASAIASSDVVDGWRDRRRDGGVLMETADGETVASGLSMPHSPRLHGGRLWLVNSGTGDFGTLDPNSGRFDPIAFCPGYARGLAFAGHDAVIGLSRPRQNRTFQGLDLDDALARHGAQARTGLLIVDTRTGTSHNWVRIDGIVEELYDVAFLPGLRCPAMIGLRGAEIRQVISISGAITRQPSCT